MSAKAKGKQAVRPAAAKLNTPVKTAADSPLNTVPGIAAVSLYAAVGRPRHPAGDKTGKAYLLDLQVAFLSGASATGIGYFYNKNDQIDFANLAVSPLPVFLLHGSIATYKGAPYGLHGEGYDFVFEVQSMSLIGYYDIENPHGNTVDASSEIIEIESSDDGGAVDNGNGVDGTGDEEDGQGEGEEEDGVEANTEDEVTAPFPPNLLTYAQVCHPIIGTFFGKVFASNKDNRVFNMDIGVYISNGAGFFMKQESAPYKPYAPVRVGWDPNRVWHGEGPPVPANGRFIAVFGQLIAIERPAHAGSRFRVQVVQVAFAAATADAASTPLLPNTLDTPASSKALFATPARSTVEKENDSKRAATPHPNAPSAKKAKAGTKTTTAGSGVKKSDTVGAGIEDAVAGEKAAAAAAPVLPKLTIALKAIGAKAANVAKGNK